MEPEKARRLEGPDAEARLRALRGRFAGVSKDLDRNRPWVFGTHARLVGPLWIAALVVAVLAAAWVWTNA
jgi:hypothetical protein